jgi:hypothetical protein
VRIHGEVCHGRRFPTRLTGCFRGMSGGRGGESVNVSGGVSNAGLRSIHREEEESPHRDEPSVSCQLLQCVAQGWQEQTK